MNTEGLQQAAREVIIADKELQRARHRLYSAIRVARERGATIPEIMKAANIARGTIYKALHATESTTASK